MCGVCWEGFNAPEMLHLATEEFCMLRRNPLFFFLACVLRKWGFFERGEAFGKMRREGVGE